MNIIVAMGLKRILKRRILSKTLNGHLACKCWLLQILVDEALKRNKLSNAFKPSSFARVAEAISKKFECYSLTKHVDNRLKTTKTIWVTITELRKKIGFRWYAKLKMITCDGTVYDEVGVRIKNIHHYSFHKLSSYSYLSHTSLFGFLFVLLNTGTTES